MSTKIAARYGEAAARNGKTTKSFTATLLRTAQCTDAQTKQLLVRGQKLSMADHSPSGLNRVNRPCSPAVSRC